MDSRTVDLKRYCLLLDRAVNTVKGEIKTESQFVSITQLLYLLEKDLLKIYLRVFIRQSR